MSEPVRTERSAPHPGAVPRDSARRDIQGLRAFAVGSVIAEHVIGSPSGGFVGVDVFFVISGFLITGLMLREADRSGRVSLVGFYRRRIKRLMPAALLVLGVTVLTAAYLLPRTRAVEVAWDGIFAAFFTVNWRLAAVGTDYFAAGQPPSPLQHYWSLSVEEQFYVVWPLVIIAILALLPVGRTSARRRGLAIGGFIAVAIVASLAWAVHESVANPTYAYFSTLSRAWELGIGALVAVVLHQTTRRVPAALAPVLSWVGVAGIVLSWFVISDATTFPAPGALLPVLSTALVLVAGAGQPASFDVRVPVLTNRVFTYVGDISYSLYLWHFPVAILLLAVMPERSVTYVLVAFALTAALSVASYHLVEDPLRRSPWMTKRMTWHRQTRVVAAWTLTVALVAGAAAAWGLTRQVDRGSIDDVASGGCAGVAYLFNDCTTDDLTGEVVPAADAVAEDTGIGYDCWREQDGPIATCGYGPEDADVRVAVVGDSHAAMLLPALRPLLVERGWRVETYVGYGCQWRTGGPDCAEVMEQVQDALTDADDPYDLVLTTAARWAVDGDDVPGSYADAWAPAVALGTEVVAIGDAPTPTEEALACVARVGYDPREDDCGTPRDTALQPADPLEEAVERTPGAAYVDVLDMYCTEDECPSTIGGVTVYRDAVGHVTATYVETAAEMLVERIDEARATLG
ncbi:acyltransferase family protein [Nocardioides zeae]|uniref:Acyltransferase family protein n=1 Tax=Nocardioides imazamoxiresistens TaxID=3231893 RepID=A0ABU3PW52_9ACTN|nr:acyltransferase family protein [Nocardioides zeae]MDT9593465.1 acyltransferase family protein [Nocardioides zeae]